MNVVTIMELKATKKVGVYKIKCDDDIILEHVKVVNSKGIFGIRQHHMKQIVLAEEEILSLLDEKSNKDLFASSVRFTHANGKVFKCPCNVEDSIGRFCNITICPTRIKVSDEVIKLVWSVENIENSLLFLAETESSSDYDEPQPDPEVLAQVEERKLKLREQILLEIEEATIHTIDAVELKLGFCAK